MSGPWDYLLYGLRLRSDLCLSELVTAAGSGDPDVIIRVGKVVGPADTGGKMIAVGGGAIFTIAGTARYAIHGGSTITIETEQDAAARNVRLYLLGSAMGMLLHQRGILPLHANTVVIGGKAVAFMGQSGAGKSTLAAWFHDHGHMVLGDDVCALRGGQREPPRVSAGLPRLRLWQNSLEASGRDHRSFPLSFSGVEGHQKYDVPLGERAPGAGELELGAIYLLDKGERLSISPLLGMEAADAVIANTYRGEYVALTGNVRSHWEACVRVVQKVRVYRLERAWDLSCSRQVVERILSHFESRPV